ncbi:MAG TPA: hypothetical protein V6C99_01145 [Oculatellaceae cyanobacterium]|jgi:hypothetical protein
MKIEETPYHFSGQSPVEKLRRPIQTGNLDAMLADFDLSFLDLLTTVSEKVALDEKETPVLEKRTASVVESKQKATEKPKLTLVEAPQKTETREEDAMTRVEKELSLLSTDLTPTDLQYLKQVVIPNVPILLGSVPLESVFPLTADGEINYRGFDVSPKLAELVEKAYKTGRPIRVELDTHSAVVLKIRNGQVSAEFVSADKGAALSMQQELDHLRNRMLLKNLPVGNLESRYRDPSQPRREQTADDERDA